MLKVYSLYLSLLLCVSLVPAAAAAADGTDKEARIPFSSPALKADKMPQVFFSHDRHIERLEAENMDCMDCHSFNGPNLAGSFKKSADLPADKQVAYVHKECVTCHANIKTGTTGPGLASCRSCHDQANAALYSAKTK